MSIVLLTGKQPLLLAGNLNLKTLELKSSAAAAASSSFFFFFFTNRDRITGVPPNLRYLHVHIAVRYTLRCFSPEQCNLKLIAQFSDDLGFKPKANFSGVVCMFQQ